MPDASKQEKEKEIRKEDELSEEVATEPEYKQLKTKPVPAIIVLLAALIASVYTYYQHKPLKDALVCILLTIIVFMVIGSVAKNILDKIKIPLPVPEIEDEIVEEEESEGETEESETV